MYFEALLQMPYGFGLMACFFVGLAASPRMKLATPLIAVMACTGIALAANAYSVGLDASFLSFAGQVNELAREAVKGFIGSVAVFVFGCFIRACVDRARHHNNRNVITIDRSYALRSVSRRTDIRT